MNRWQAFVLRVPIKEQILFARNMSLMIKTGVPIIDSLHMLERQCKSGNLKKILASVTADVQEGRFLATALKKYETVFGSLFINIVQVGEASSSLAENLGFLADDLKKRQVVQGKILSAALYPVIILITTFALSAALAFFILPRIIPVFSTLRVPLPLPTRILIATDKFILADWPWILGLAILLVVIWRSLIAVPKVRFRYHALILRLPVVGAMIVSVQMSMFARTLSLLLKSGIKIVEAISIAAESTTNLAYKRAFAEIGDRIKGGEPLGRCLQSYPDLFPTMFGQMIEVSETSGALDSTLLYLSEYYENEIDDTTQNLVSLLEPLLMLVMGGIVGFMAISVIMPIYSISQTIGGK